jgi:hypothetical protein
MSHARRESSTDGLITVPSVVRVLCWQILAGRLHVCRIVGCCHPSRLVGHHFSIGEYCKMTDTCAGTLYVLSASGEI